MPEKYLGRAAWTVAACTLLGLTTGGIWLTKNAARGVFHDWDSVLFNEVLFWNGWGALSPIVFWLCRRLPLQWGRGAGRLLLHLPAALLLPLGGYALALGAGALLGTLAGQTGVVDDALGRFQGHYVYGIGGIFGFLIYWLTAFIAYADAYYRSYRREEVRRSQLETRLAQAQLQALKMQLHPHFFFNTLNSISSLLHTDPRAADAMLAKLGDFLRLTLDNNHVEHASLKDELDFVRRYMEIEQIRFGDRLAVSIEARGQAETARVPSLILQPLVENAVAHGVSRLVGPGRVEVRAGVEGDRLEIQVHDSGPGLAADERGEDLFGRGIGLSNTRARLQEHYGDRFALDLANGPEGGLLVRLNLPYEAYVQREAAG